MSTYNIIGDIHGRDSWKRLVHDNCINIYGTHVKQIVGHTRVKEICEVTGVIMVDCLDMLEQSYKVTCP